MTGSSLIIERSSSSPSSSFARVSLLIYLLLIIYASWYPFSGWRDVGLTPWAFLSAPLPHYWTLFDVWTNIVGYMPLGLLTVLVLPRRIPLTLTVILVTLAGILFSGVMEAVQTYLPTRVSSNLDLLTNSIGALSGSIIGAIFRYRFSPENKLLLLRERWFNREASHGMVMIALWPLAQLAPLNHLFGFGQVTSMLSTWLSDWFEQPIDLAAWMTNDVQLSAEQYWMTESIITACGLVSAGLMLMIVLRKDAPKVALTFLLIWVTLSVKAFASALLFTPENVLVWLTPGALTGLLVGAVVLVTFGFTPQRVQRWVAALAVFVSLVFVNVIPDNPYYVETLQTWSLGKFLNFNGAAQFLALLWPFFTLWFLFHPMHRAKRNDSGV
ncbi:VanZ family protein [Glaciimonas sp. CA11.2]|uniref:VanZ family protein n=1 Tax=unclassified Glaciimonas TaxID=2644401 RepID=UPI002AB35043|nr:MULTISPECIES: VanZ family protein [unclassified Glaciimonas]MDY7546222.1 VanZ family protein [Glaciimonas sp. CA11.2]MEB0010829.1 VanZ family protein [Glaciimonas sp. Cout2]MEB0081610.1 VanZ family protein [Glaciimonas sp. Gout2]MEB0162511.1 VanZ family protein [Glaciimonas sp. CA11.2]